MSATAMTCYPEGHDTLGFLREPAAKMFSRIDQYIDRFLRAGYAEVPYKFNERATLSLLAGGIWLASEHNLVLEEIIADKRSEECNYRGREDIWFIAGEKRCSAEAKQTWPDASRFTQQAAQAALEVLQGEAAAAWTNAQDALQKEELDYALGILFVVPHLQIKHSKRAAELFETYRSTLASALQSFALSKGRDVFWGSYLRPELLDERNFYASSDRGKATRPALDVLVCRYFQGL